MAATGPAERRQDRQPVVEVVAAGPRPGPAQLREGEDLSAIRAALLRLQAAQQAAANKASKPKS